MSEAKDKDKKKTLSLGGKGTLSLKSGNVAPPSPPTPLSHGRGKTVAVEIRRRRTPGQDGGGAEEQQQQAETDRLTNEERESRLRALRQAEETGKAQQDKPASLPQPLPGRPVTSGGAGNAAFKSLREQEMEEMRRIEAEENAKKTGAAPGFADAKGHYGQRGAGGMLAEDEAEEESYRKRMKRGKVAEKQPRRSHGDEDNRRMRRLTVTQVLNEDYERDRGPSLAAQRRAREKARMAASGQSQEQQKIIREVIVPETITVQELSNRMAERAGDLIKALMKMGMMATITQSIDADTAELLISEFGHKIKRVTEADVEEGLEGPADREEDLVSRPPVVTIMGHVDHGKTSLLDALRETDVVSGEAGGITQHIGAYQVTMKSSAKITFLDTPGHAAFSEMRARGANITDIVVLVVAANDSIMPQTIEAISHAKAAEVPMIVAINKVDLPDANVTKVKTDLLQHEVMVEGMGGDVLCIEVSAKQKKNLDKLEEAILLQAEILNLKANPSRAASGTVVESKLEQGRGNVATVLIQNGTLRIGDIFVIGSEWGRVRALIDDHTQNVQEAAPGQPVEVLGLQGSPEAGDRLDVVENEARAREISSYRQRKKRDLAAVKGASSFEELMAAAKAGKKKELAVVIKADVHGSIEAIIGSLRKIEEENEEVGVRVLHSGAGAITESDATLARASKALIIGFNVRPNAQARDMIEKDKIDARYYNIIYNVIDDVKAALGGLLSPIVREIYLGNAEIRQVFNISKIGKIAGCMVTSGVVKRGSGVRLLRDNVVIHEGKLKTLKRFKDEVKEVKEGTECGMAFESYDDIKDGDVIECFETVEEARTVA
ncbi:MAG: translation initiation factor IF-2 [Proteobacteria bacterium]|nr:translation initiation factor IF-2 [Pseudomonadota bacterium]